MERRLLERTFDVAAASGGFGVRPLRAALDRSPLWGAGRVEDTYNLLGHALRKALGVMARQQGRGLRAIAEAAGQLWAPDRAPGAALALAWDDPGARQQALTRLLARLTAVEPWLDTQPVQEAPTRAAASLAVAKQGCAQDLTTAPDGTPTLRQGASRRRSAP